jgi:hypothetical protein
MTSASASSPLDRDRAAAFVDQLKAAYQGAVLTMLVDLGRRLGLLEAFAAGPATSVELARRVNCAERPVREWCGGMAVAGVLDYDAATQGFTLPAEHALWLTGERHTNLAPMAGLIAGLAPRADDVEASFRSGAGVAYERYRPHFTHAMDSVGRARYDALLVRAYLPTAPGLAERLGSGAEVLDVGCGTGHCLNLMAQAFPASTFLGLDFSEDAIALARIETHAMGLSNVTFDVADVSRLPQNSFDVVFAFDAIHDQSDPQGVLQQIHGALRDGGELFMVDIRASSDLANNLGDPLKIVLYGTSVFHCMQVSLAGGGPGLGTVWGTELASSMLQEAGFGSVTVHNIEADPSNCIYVCRP